MTVQAQFNGKQYIQPGSASRIDSTALNNPQLGFSGIAAIIGSCKSGQPKVPQLFNSAGQLKGALGSGPAYDGARMAFSPSTQLVEGNNVRPQLVYVIRADQATQSTKTLLDANTTPSIVLTSSDYGFQTNQISVQVTSGTSPSVNVKLAYNGAVENYNNVGVNAILNVKYSGGASTAVANITATSFATTLGSGAGSDQPITATFAQFPTLQNLLDYINSFTHYLATTTISNPTTFNCSDLDYMSSVDIINGSAGGNLYAVVSGVVNAINLGSSLVSATRSASPNGLLAPNPLATTYFTGGTTTAPVNTDYAACLTALQAYSVNFVALAAPATVANGLASVFAPWLDTMQGKNECHGHIGTSILGSPSTSTFSAMQSLTSSVNDVNVNFWSDAALVPNDQGTPTQYDSWMMACIAAGFQAGTPPGTSFVQKSFNILQAIHNPNIVGNSDLLDPNQNGDAMVLARFSFLKFNDATKSWNVVRALTTYSQDGNDYNTEPGIRSATNYAVYSFRQDIEQKFLGARTLFNQAGSTADSAKNELLAHARLLEDANIIVKGTVLQNNQIVTLPSIVVDNVSISGDILRLRYGIRPIGSINFIFHDISLNSVQQVATT